MSDKNIVFCFFMVMILASIMFLMEMMISRKITESERRIEEKIESIGDKVYRIATETDAEVEKDEPPIVMSVGNILYHPCKGQIMNEKDEDEDFIDNEIKIDSGASQGGYIGIYELTAYIETGNPCADGSYPQVGWTVACNDSRLWHHKIRIEGYGEFYVHDTGGMANNVIDIFVGSYDEAIQFGRQSGEVYIID